jgi:hypothetical protein
MTRCLIDMGADVSDYFTDIFVRVQHGAQVVFSALCECSRLTEADDRVYSLFSLMKLMLSVLSDDGVLPGTGTGTGGVDGAREVFELAVAGGFNRTIASSAAPLARGVSYPLRRRLCGQACRVYLESLLFDGERISVGTKARRYVELVCLFLDRAMLRDVCALRMTCKSNQENRRFPVCYSEYRELEANLIEGWLGHDACRFVSTGQLHHVMAMHDDIS